LLVSGLRRRWRCLLICLLGRIRLLLLLPLRLLFMAEQFVQNAHKILNCHNCPMSDYQRLLDISAPADAVFAFVSNLANFPHYLPTVHKAESIGEGRVRLHGEAQGHPYTAEGNYKMDASLRTMEWDADGPQGYSGSLTVQPGDVETSFSEVTLMLSYANTQPSDPPSKHDEQILEAIDRTLQSIQQHVEKK
jgi:uncharacterized membrane protein